MVTFEHVDFQLTQDVIRKVKHFNPRSGQALSVELPLVVDPLALLRQTLAHRGQSGSHTRVEVEASSDGAAEASVHASTSGSTER